MLFICPQLQQFQMCDIVVMESQELVAMKNGCK